MWYSFFLPVLGWKKPFNWFWVITTVKLLGILVNNNFEKMVDNFLYSLVDGLKKARIYLSLLLFYLIIFNDSLYFACIISYLPFKTSALFKNKKINILVVIDSKEVSEKQNFYAPHYKNLYPCLYVSFTDKFNNKFSVSKVNRQNFYKKEC